MKALVVGNGVMGHHHARILRRLGLEVETVDPVNGDHHRLGIATSADIACIATPPANLAQEAAIAMELGMDVLIEKPMAVDVDDAQLILHTELSTGRKVRVGYTERWNPAVGMAKEALPLIGTLRHVTAQRLGLRPRCPRTNVALDLLTHDIDVLRFLNLWPRFEHSTKGEDHVAATYALANGGHATLIASHLHSAKQRTLTLTGDKGTLHVDYQRQTVVIHGEVTSELEVMRCEPLEWQWRAFLAGDGVTTGDARATLGLALRASKGGVLSQGAPTCIAQ